MRNCVVAIVAVMTFHGSSSCQAGIVLVGGARWDAAPRVVSGNERSLDGGLRYSMEGGSLQAYRDRFSWTVVPTVSEFQQAISQAFGAWTAPDPVSGLTTSVRFVQDLATPVVRQVGIGTLNPNGAEIDLLASDGGSGALSGLTAIDFFGTPVTLTSGVANYANSVTIQGVDLHMNSNPAAVYSLDAFRRVLTHEIGHAIGLGDVDLGGAFIDDNYNAANPVATLTNAWAGLVNPLDPANSAGLGSFAVPTANFALAGVDILMESNGLGLSANNPLTNLFPLRNDDYAMRQFLYPSLVAVPEPSSVLLVGALCAIIGWFRSAPHPTPLSKNS